MESILFFALISIAQLSIYLYRNETLKRHASESSKNLEKEQNEYVAFNSNKDAQQIEQGILTKNLKHLEFISQFETYLEADNAQNFSVEFLQEFEAIKTKAQVSTIKSAQLVKHKVAA